MSPALEDEAGVQWTGLSGRDGEDNLKDVVIDPNASRSVAMDHLYNLIIPISK